MKVVITIFVLLLSFGFSVQLIDFPFNQKENFTISNLKKEYSYSKSSDDSLICKNWKLDSIIIKQALSSFTQITNSEWHYQFYHFPCSYSGFINQKNRKIKFEINAGSWISIQLNDTTFLLGDIDMKLKNTSWKRLTKILDNKNRGEPRNS